jgi:hypothetical protein
MFIVYVSNIFFKKFHFYAKLVEPRPTRPELSRRQCARARTADAAKVSILSGF